MPRHALVFLLAIASWAPAIVFAQEGAAPEVVETTGGPVVIDTRWSDGSPRRAEVDLVRGGSRVRAFEGRTVRTAAAANGDVVAVGYYHGGPEPFAGVVLVDLASGRRSEASIPVAGARSPLRPAGLVITSDAQGFAILLQEQQADPNADVHSVFARIALDGTWREPPHDAPIPWGLAALASRPDGTYELAVLFGGFGDARAGQARICIVTLREGGQPTEHPWWASANASLTDVRIAGSAGGIDLFYRTVEGRLVHHAFARDGSWGQEPAAGDVVLELTPAQSFYVSRLGAVATARVHTP